MYISILYFPSISSIFTNVPAIIRQCYAHRSEFFASITATFSHVAASIVEMAFRESEQRRAIGRPIGQRDVLITLSSGSSLFYDPFLEFPYVALRRWST